jgi:ABC-type nitrate/sulfonate/bicarbonate transport system permease component
MWSLRQHPSYMYRVCIGVIDALPFAFVGMVFGEVFGSVSGLGFFMVVSGAGSQTIDRVSACFLIVSLLGMISFTFECLAKRMRGELVQV